MSPSKRTSKAAERIGPAGGNIPAGSRFGLESQQPLDALHRAWDEAADVALIVLLDGKGGDGPGGTADMVRLATERGVKVIRIDPATLG